MLNEYNMLTQQGWQCPICGRVLAPWVYECPCGGQGIRTYTSNKTDILFPNNVQIVDGVMTEKSNKEK